MSHHPSDNHELPASPTRIVVFMVIALVSGGALAAWMDRPAGPECQGTLLARVTTIRCREDWRITAVHVAEGDTVNSGDPLLTYTDRHREQRREDQQERIASLKRELDRLTKQAELELAWRSKDLESEICAIQLKSADYLKEKYDFELQKSMLADLLSENQFVMVDQNGRSFESVVLKNKLPKSDRMATVMHLEVASNAAEVSAAQVELCDQREQGLRRLKESLPVQIRKTLGIEATEAQLSAAQAELDALTVADNAQVLTSPAVGKIGAVRVHVGEPADPGTPVLEIVDDVERSISVDVPSQHLFRFSLGTDVRVVFPGKIQRTGRVSKVATLAESTGDQRDSTLRVTVEPSGKLWPTVPVGSRLPVYPVK